MGCVKEGKAARVAAMGCEFELTRSLPNGH